MINKITKGKSFGGALDYVFDKKKEAELLEGKGVLTDSIKSMKDCFELQASMNPSLKANMVYHISLSFSVQDKDRLTNEMMLQIAHEYMQRMGIVNTQYVIARHHDREHPHIHIVINRVDNNGKTISDKKDRDRGKTVCRYLTEKYGLYIAKDKSHVKRDRLRGSDKTKYEIYDAISAGLKTCDSWKSLVEHLRQYNIEVELKYRSGTDEVQGVKFIKDGIAFSGSKVDRNFSYSKLSRRLAENREVKVLKETKVKKVVKRSRPVSAPKLARKAVQFTDALGNLLTKDVYVPDTVSESAEDDYTTEDEKIEEKKWTWGHGFKR